MAHFDQGRSGGAIVIIRMDTRAIKAGGEKRIWNESYKPENWFRQTETKMLLSHKTFCFYFYELPTRYIHGSMECVRINRENVTSYGTNENERHESRNVCFVSTNETISTIWEEKEWPSFVWPVIFMHTQRLSQTQCCLLSAVYTLRPVVSVSFVQQPTRFPLLCNIATRWVVVDHIFFFFFFHVAKMANCPLAVINAMPRKERPGCFSPFASWM